MSRNSPINLRMSFLPGGVFAARFRRSRAGRRRIAAEPLEVLTKLANCSIEVSDVPKRARLHDATLHGGQNKLGQFASIKVGRQARLRLFQAFADSVNPCAEVLRQPLADRWVGLVQLQRQAADRTTIEAVGVRQRLSITGEQRKYLLDGIVHAGPGGLQQHLPDAVGYMS